MTHTLPPHVKWTRERACDGKIRYRTAVQAMQAAVRSAYAYRELLTTWGYYRCRFCSHWHAGHKAGGGRG